MQSRVMKPALRAALIAGLGVVVVIFAFWAAGGMAALDRWAAAGQREVQGAMAGAIRQLKGGNPGALTALLGVSFAYGFFHAVGPGHGKMLIGAYGLGRRVRLVPLAAIAVLSSLAQATTAVALVYAGVLALGWTRDQMVGVSDRIMAPAAHAAVAMIGLWLVWRGWRGVQAAARADRPPTDHAMAHGGGGDHRHDDPGHVHDAHCGHSHGPTLQDVAGLTGWRDALALVAGIAIRPCTGALFVLILTLGMGIGGMGILAAYAMGLGTASVTLVVAVLSVWAREGALASLPGSRIARAVPVMELGAGVLVTVLATQLLVRSL